MTCKICNKPRVNETTQDFQRWQLKRHLNVWLYTCQCPLYMLDELDIAESKNFDVDRHAHERLMAVYKQKYKFAEKHNIRGEAFRSTFLSLLSKDPTLTDKKGSSVYSYETQEKIREAKRLYYSGIGIVKVR